MNSLYDLNFYFFPFTQPEIIPCRQRQKRFCNWYGNECTYWSHIKTFCQHPCKRDLEKPKPEQVDNSRGSCITGAVKRIYHHHSNTIKNIACANDT